MESHQYSHCNMSQLITLFQRVINEHGDLPVTFVDNKISICSDSIDDLLHLDDIKNPDHIEGTKVCDNFLEIPNDRNLLKKSSSVSKRDSSPNNIPMNSSPDDEHMCSSWELFISHILPRIVVLIIFVLLLPSNGNNN